MGFVICIHFNPTMVFAYDIGIAILLSVSDRYPSLFSQLCVKQREMYSLLYHLLATCCLFQCLSVNRDQRGLMPRGEGARGGVMN